MAVPSNDARGFVEGVIRYMKTEGKVSAALPKVELLLYKMSKRDRQQKIATVEVTSELSEKQRQTIEKVLERLVDHSLEVEFKINPELIAGLRVEIGDFRFDSSLAWQLDRIGLAIE